MRSLLAISQSRRLESLPPTTGVDDMLLVLHSAPGAKLPFRHGRDQVEGVLKIPHPGMGVIDWAMSPLVTRRRREALMRIALGSISWALRLLERCAILLGASLAPAEL